MQLRLQKSKRQKRRKPRSEKYCPVNLDNSLTLKSVSQKEKGRCTSASQPEFNRSGPT